LLSCESGQAKRSSGEDPPNSPQGWRARSKFLELSTAEHNCKRRSTQRPPFAPHSTSTVCSLAVEHMKTRTYIIYQPRTFARALCSPAPGSPDAVGARNTRVAEFEVPEAVVADVRVAPETAIVFPHSVALFCHAGWNAARDLVVSQVELRQRRELADPEGGRAKELVDPGSERARGGVRGRAKGYVLGRDAGDLVVEQVEQRQRRELADPESGCVTIRSCYRS
jgi:hypothetical protein